MDLTWPEDLADYRREAQVWLRENLSGREFPKHRTKESIGALIDWERALFDAGYAGMDWPVEYGGQGADPIRTTIFNEEYALSGAPIRLNRQASGLFAPTLMHFGTEEQRRRWLRNILTCDDIWCQGFSEPDAGSDLASLRTTAHRDGDHYIVNGQKVWASNGPIADWIFALVRTDRAAPKHRGISYLPIDLRSPGVEVRPIAQVSGYAEFAEVFFVDVAVPVENRVGPEHEGWRVAMTTLTYERGKGRYSASFFQATLNDAREILEHSGRSNDPSVRSEAARLRAKIRCYELNHLAMLTSGREESTAGIEATHKLVWSEMQTQIYEFGMRMLGEGYELGSAGVPAGINDWHERYWLSRAALIYAGTNEIQRNIIAERSLGLPKEPKAS